MSSFKKEKEIQQSITDSINKILSEAVVNGFAPPAKQGAAISVPSKNAGAFTSQSSLPDTEENDPAEEVYKSILLPKKPSPVIRTVNGIMKDITTKKPSPVIDTVNGIMKDITAPAPVAEKKPSPVIDTVNGIMKDITTPVAAKKPSPVIDTVNGIMKDITAPMGTPNTSGTAIRSPFVAKPQINTPATNPGFMVSPQGAPSSRPSQTGDFKVTPANPSTPATNPGFMVSPQGAPSLESPSQPPQPIKTSTPDITELSPDERYKKTMAAGNFGGAGIADTASMKERATETSVRKETASDVVGGAAAAAAAYRNNPIAPEGYDNKRGMTRADFNAKRDAAEEAAYPGSTKGRPARGGGSNVGLSSSLYGAPNSEPISTTPVPSQPGTKLTTGQMGTRSNKIDDIAKVAWWRRTSAQRSAMKTSEDTKATAQRKADVDRVQAQRTATEAREKNEDARLDRYRQNRQNVQEQTKDPRDPNDPLYGLNIKQSTKRDFDTDMKSLAVKTGQFGIDTAKNALKLGTLIAIPPEELASTATGRMAGLGYSKQGAEKRFDYYRTKIDQVPGALAGLVSDAGSLLKNYVPGLSNVVGKTVGKAVNAVTNSKLGKMGSAVADSNTGKAIASAAQTYGRAASDEAAKLMTGALYDPRSVSLSLGSEYIEPKEEQKTKTP